MTVAEAKKHIVGPAIRQQCKDALSRHRDADDLESLGIGRQELPKLTRKIHGLLRENGWSIDPKVLKTLQPNTRIADLTNAIARHTLVKGPKTCANGHPPDLSRTNRVRPGPASV